MFYGQLIGDHSWLQNVMSKKRCTNMASSSLQQRRRDSRAISRLTQ